MAVFGPKREDYSALSFMTIEGLLLLGTILAITGVATIDWVEQTYKLGNFSFHVMVGLYKLKTTSGSTTATTAARWCGVGDNDFSTAYCHKVEAIKGLVITTAVLGFLALATFSATRGRSPPVVSMVCALASLLCGIFLWVSCGLWSSVKDGYCDDLNPVYTQYECKLGPSLTEVATAGCFFFLAAVLLMVVKKPSPSSSTAALLGNRVV